MQVVVGQKLTQKMTIWIVLMSLFFCVSHKDVPPDDWNISLLVYDIFHGRGNYVKLQLWYACQLLEGNFDAVDTFFLSA